MRRKMNSMLVILQHLRPTVKDIMLDMSWMPYERYRKLGWQDSTPRDVPRDDAWDAWHLGMTEHQHRHMEKHVRKLRGLPAPAPRPSKFNTTLKQHQRGKLVHNLKWGFPPKKSAIDPDFLAEHIRQNGPYLYHGTSLDAAKSILNEGLYPHDHENVMNDESGDEEWPEDEDGEPIFSRSNWAGQFLAPRAGHVYLGTHKYASNYGGIGGKMLKVDLRKLDPQKMNADEDHFGETAIYNSSSPEHRQYLEKLNLFDPPPSPVDPETLESLGEWADRALGGDPEATRHSVASGSMAYNGHIPPEAVSLWQPGDEARPETPEAAHAGWDLSQDPGAPGTSAPMQVAAATDANHFEAKMFHGNPNGLLRGSPRVPFWMTDHEQEAKDYGGVSDPDDPWAPDSPGVVHPFSVRFKDPLHLFGPAWGGAPMVQDAQQRGHDGIVVHFPDNSDPSAPLPARQWGLALDPGSITPGHDHSWPYSGS
jgi:hypothetical protein